MLADSVLVDNYRVKLDPAPEGGTDFINASHMRVSVITYPLHNINS